MTCKRLPTAVHVHHGHSSQGLGKFFVRYSLQNRRYFFFLRFSGERGQAQGEREVRDARREGRVSRTSRLPSVA